MRCLSPILLFTVCVRAFDNTCLLNDANLTPPTKNGPQTFLKDCPKWVIDTTDAVWNTREDINGSLEQYFYEDWSSTSSWGHQIHGMDKLKNLVASTLRAFPDLQIHITDVFCYGNDLLIALLFWQSLKKWDVS